MGKGRLFVPSTIVASAICGICRPTQASIMESTASNVGLTVWENEILIF